MVVLISACSVTAEVNESSAPKVTEPDQGSEPMENTGTIETPEITGTKGPSEQGYGEKIALTTSDGVQLAAVFYAPESLNAAPDVLILVHEAYRDRSTWDDFRTAALENGYAVVALDLRGHG